MGAWRQRCTSGNEFMEGGRESNGGQISNKLKGKVLRASVTPAFLYDLESVALTEQQQQERSLRKHLCAESYRNKEDGYEEDEWPEGRDRDGVQLNWKNGRKPNDMGRSRGGEGWLHTKAEAMKRKAVEKVQVTTKIGRLRKEGCKAGRGGRQVEGEGCR